MGPKDLILEPSHPLDPVQVLADLNHALQSRDGEEIDEAVLAAFQVGLRREFVPSFTSILRLRNHHAHEDIVSGLQQLKDTRSVESLYDAALARHEYLDYDESFGLARKCTWALADIGTSDALAKLELLASFENPVIAGYAQKRIDQWDEEQHRKGA